ncbi:MAG: PilN domain-containing protein [Thermodesulfobacteriota bacterium]|nr:PilN domain-containing protein [Thermodesulfobacteriota bacterium]
MIKINLLPFRAARKRENVKRQITISVLLVSAILLAMLYVYIQLASTLSNLKTEEKKIKTELATYKKTINRINFLEKRIKSLKTKLAVIKNLQKGKTGPVHLLDEVAMAVPRNKLWLTSLNESKGSLTLTGTAKDNDTVALFMTNLEKSAYIKSVDLQSAKLKPMPAHKLKASNFVLKCRTYAFKTKKPRAKKGRR